MSGLTPITRPHAYLEAILAGLPKAVPMELPGILREVARNLEALANDAERYLTQVEEPDDY